MKKEIISKLAVAALFLSCNQYVLAEKAEDSVVAVLKDKSATLQVMEKKLAESGRYDSYAHMRSVLATRFVTYLEHDRKNNRVPLTDYAERDLNKLLDMEIERVSSILKGKAKPVVSPRRVKSDVPVIVGSHLEQKVVYPDGKTEKRPVFLFGFGHFSRMQKDITFLGDLGCNFCQTELGPRNVWTAENKWNQGIIDRYKLFIKQADKAGVLVDLLLSPHYMPKWQYKAHPDWQSYGGGFNKFSLNRPDLRNFLKETFQREVKELSVAKNFRTVCVMNEPVFFNAWGDPDTRRLWEEYLKNKYTSLDNLNDAWETEYEGWGNVPDYKITPSCPLPDEPALYDWMQFNDSRFAGFMGWISDCVHEADKNKLTHAKMIDREFTQYNVMQGSDLGLISRATDMAGNDWGCRILNEDRDITDNLNFAFGYSIMHLASGRPIINTENHLIRGGTGDLRRNAVRAPFWLEAVCGLDASAAWSWEKWDKPEGDWTLGMWLYRPRTTEEYMRTGLDIMRLMPEIIKLRNVPCRVAILHSRTTALRNPKYAKYIKRIYTALQQMGIPIGVVTEKMIADGELMKKLPDLKVLILPGTTHLPDQVYNNIKIVAANTGAAVKLVGVGRKIAFFNEFSQERDVDMLSDTAIIYRHLGFAKKDALWISLNTALQSLGVKRNYTLVDETTGKPARGVFYRVAEADKKLTATVVNMTYEQMKCHWEDSKGNKLKFTDKLELVPSVDNAAEITMQPLSVLFGELN